MSADGSAIVVLKPLTRGKGKGGHLDSSTPIQEYNEIKQAKKICRLLAWLTDVKN